MAESCSECAREIGEYEVACVAEERVVCRECHDKQYPVCPNCQAALPKRPASKRPCPACGKPIVVRTGQLFFPSIYLTKKQAAEVDRYEGKTGEYYARARARLLAGGRVPTPREVIILAEDESPASDAQLRYVRDLGMAPARETQREMARLLDTYHTFRWDVIEAVREAAARGIEMEVNQRQIGVVVAILLEDAEFLGLSGLGGTTNGPEWRFICEEWNDRRASKELTQRIRAVVRANYDCIAGIR